MWPRRSVDRAAAHFTKAHRPLRWSGAHASSRSKCVAVAVWRSCDMLPHLIPPKLRGQPHRQDDPCERAPSSGGAGVLFRTRRPRSSRFSSFRCRCAAWFLVASEARLPRRRLKADARDCRTQRVSASGKESGCPEEVGDPSVKRDRGYGGFARRGQGVSVCLCAWKARSSRAFPRARGI